MKSEFEDVGSFHEKFGFEQRERPGFLNDEQMRVRLNFSLEELLETAEAAGYRLWVNRANDVEEVGKPFFSRDYSMKPDLAKFFDGLIDMNYVSCGLAWLCRLPWLEGWRRVHQANMKKERVLRKEDSTRGTTFDVRKPEGWTAPTFDDILGANCGECDVSFKCFKNIDDCIRDPKNEPKSAMGEIIREELNRG